MVKVCHLTSVHPRNDVRIFHKQCKSLADAGYNTTLVVADGLGNQSPDGVTILDVGSPSNRISRIFFSTFKVFKKGRKLNSDIYHFHDPELIFYAFFLKLSGKKVIFDVHENIVEQIKDKSWLPKVLRYFVSFIFRFINLLAERFFVLVLAEHSYSKIYNRWKSNYPTTFILNYPKTISLNKFKSVRRCGNEFFYMGVVSNQRGLDIILKACAILHKKNIDFRVHFVGEISDEIEVDKYQFLKDKIIFYGRLDLLKGYEISMRCIAGLAVIKPLNNFIESYPTKIFEYMTIGLPVITSNFELYKEVVLHNNAGVCVCPNSFIDLADVMMSFIDRKYDITAFATQGMNSVEEKYSWQSEEKKLLKLYNRLLTNE